jgi:MFS family permease
MSTSDAAVTISHPRDTQAFGWRIVTPLLTAASLNPINSSVIATALVPLAIALHIPVGRTAILVSSLYLASAIAQPTAGKLAEEFGPRIVFLAGAVLVMLGGVVGGVVYAVLYGITQWLEAARGLSPERPVWSCCRWAPSPRRSLTRCPGATSSARR